jgi:hypothetical protein
MSAVASKMLRPWPTLGCCPVREREREREIFYGFIQESERERESSEHVDGICLRLSDVIQILI